MSDAAEVEVSVEAPDLRGLVAGLRDFSPRLARELRTFSAQTGDDAIRGARQVLRGPLPRSTGGRSKRRTRRRRGEPLRQGVARGLRAVPVTQGGAEGVQIKAADPRSGLWASRSWRHPVFGKAPEVTQRGQDYLAPVFDGRRRLDRGMRVVVDGVIDKTLK